MKPSVLLLDVMDTLVRDPFHDAIPSFFGMTLEELLREKHPTAWVDFELGKLTEAEYLERMFADRRPVDRRRFTRHLARAYEWVAGAEDLLQQLRDARHSMYALSNYPVWYEIIDAQLGLSRYLGWDFVSCRTGWRKPARGAFENAVRRLGVEARACLFIDDRAANCEAADRMGMRVIHFQDVSSLRTSLRALQLL